MGWFCSKSRFISSWDTSPSSQVSNCDQDLMDHKFADLSLETIAYLFPEKQTGGFSVKRQVCSNYFTCGNCRTYRGIVSPLFHFNLCQYEVSFTVKRNLIQITNNNEIQQKPTRYYGGSWKYLARLMEILI